MIVVLLLMFEFVFLNLLHPEISNLVIALNLVRVASENNPLNIFLSP